uniref:Uncharacterized protein n=1 Tax=Octopus bimaculoides TaxID=37653 RepID=A0A0L8HR84_OCTBM
MERKRKTAASISKELLEVENNSSECIINPKLPVEITMNICKKKKKRKIPDRSNQYKFFTKS